MNGLVDTRDGYLGRVSLPAKDLARLLDLCNAAEGLQEGESHREYGIRVDAPQVMTLDSTPSLREATARLDRYRDIWPEAYVAVREVHEGPWKPLPTEDEVVG